MGQNLKNINPIYENARELCIDATILLDKKRYRRSLFLFLTALEELIKCIQILEKGSDHKDIFNHSKKFGFLTTALSEFIKKIDWTDISMDVVDRVGKNFEPKLRTRAFEICDTFESVMKSFLDDLVNFPELRKKLLYQDLTGGSSIIMDPILICLVCDKFSKLVSDSLNSFDESIG